MNSEITSVGAITPVIYPHIYNVKHDDDPDYRGTAVKQVAVDKIMVNNHTYQLVYDYRAGFDPERFGQRYETILNKYDYIVGDWGFEQLRLRGFYQSQNRTANRDQIITTLEDYINDFCNFGCAFFVLQREGGPAKPTNKRGNAEQSHGNHEPHHRNRRNKNNSNQHHDRQPAITAKHQAKSTIKVTNSATSAATGNQATTKQTQPKSNRRNNRRKGTATNQSTGQPTASANKKAKQSSSKRSSRVTTEQSASTKQAKAHPFRIRHVNNQ